MDSETEEGKNLRDADRASRLDARIARERRKREKEQAKAKAAEAATGDPAEVVRTAIRLIHFYLLDESQPMRSRARIAQAIVLRQIPEKHETRAEITHHQGVDPATVEELKAFSEVELSRRIAALLAEQRS